MHAALAGLPTHDDRGFDAGQGGPGLATKTTAKDNAAKVIDASSACL